MRVCSCVFVPKYCVIFNYAKTDLGKHMGDRMGLQKGSVTNLDVAPTVEHTVLSKQTVSAHPVGIQQVRHWISIFRQACGEQYHLRFVSERETRSHVCERFLQIAYQINGSQHISRTIKSFLHQRFVARRTKDILMPTKSMNRQVVLHVHGPAFAAVEERGSSPRIEVPWL